MTRDEIEIYNQLRNEALAEQDENERQTAQLFQEQQSIAPDLIPASEYTPPAKPS